MHGTFLCTCDSHATIYIYIILISVNGELDVNIRDTCVLADWKQWGRCSCVFIFLEFEPPGWRDDSSTGSSSFFFFCSFRFRDPPIIYAHMSFLTLVLCVTHCLFVFFFRLLSHVSVGVIFTICMFIHVSTLSWLILLISLVSDLN